MKNKLEKINLKFFLIYIILVLISIAPYIARGDSPAIVKAHYFVGKGSADLPSWFIVQMIGIKTSPSHVITYLVIDNNYIINNNGFLENLIKNKLLEIPIRKSRPPHVAVVGSSNFPNVDMTSCAGTVYYYRDGSWLEVSNGLIIRGYLKLSSGEAVFMRLSYVEGVRASDLPCSIDFINPVTTSALVGSSLIVLIQAVRAVLSFDLERILREEIFYYDYY